MKIHAVDSFEKSLKRFLNTEKPWRWEYWRDKWYAFKRAIWALRKYFRITTKMVPWDHSSVLMMLKFQVGLLADYIEKKGIEVDESRLPKVARMRRFIELMDHKIADDYAERCGYNYGYGFDFVPVEGSSDLTELVSNAPPDVEDNNSKAIMEAHELEEREWEEMFDILKNDLRSWWD
jgi:hypothetical protein